MIRILRNGWLTAIVLAASIGAGAQEAATSIVHSRLALPRQARHVSPPAVIWLQPLKQPAGSTAPPPGQFTLLQKNRMFAPHLLVIPVGSEVLFPNADPFFHNVFSLFDGKRFDLGLYEAGSTKGVRFSREGISYIFCNIHPEMSAVVVALTTSYYAVADAKGSFELRNIPPGEYELHVWIEGLQQPALKELTRRVHLAAGTNDLGQFDVATFQQHPEEHLNKFGKPYERDAKPTY